MLKAYQQLCDRSRSKYFQRYKNTEFFKVAHNSFEDGYLEAMKDMLPEDDVAKLLSDNYSDLKDKMILLKAKHKEFKRILTEIQADVAWVNGTPLSEDRFGLGHFPMKIEEDYSPPSVV